MKMTTNTREISRIIRKRYEHLYANKWEDLEEMINSQKHKLPRLKREDTENLKRLITINDIRLVTEKHLTYESPGFTGEIYQTLKEELISILLKLFQSTEEDRRLQTHLMRPALP